MTDKTSNQTQDQEGLGSTNVSEHQSDQGIDLSRRMFFKRVAVGGGATLVGGAGAYSALLHRLRAKLLNLPGNLRRL